VGGAPILPYCVLTRFPLPLASVVRGDADFGNQQRYASCYYDQAAYVSYTSHLILRMTSHDRTYEVTEQMLKRVGECNSNIGIYTNDNLGYRARLVDQPTLPVNTWNVERIDYVHTRTVYSDDDAMEMRNLCQTGCCRFRGKSRVNDVLGCGFAACGNSSLTYAQWQWQSDNIFAVTEYTCKASDVQSVFNYSAPYIRMYRIAATQIRCLNYSGCVLLVLSLILAPLYSACCCCCCYRN
jgi:hypothetical protein